MLLSKRVKGQSGSRAYPDKKPDEYPGSSPGILPVRETALPYRANRGACD